MKKLLRIDVNLSEAIANLIAYKERVNRIMNDVLETVCDEIVRIAQGLYGREVRVTYTPVKTDGDTMVYRVDADGRAVVFLEFGAGYTTDGTTVQAQVFYENTGIKVELGSFSASEDGTGEFIRTHIETGGHGYWTLLNGVRLDHVEPRRALHQAIENVMAEFDELATKDRG